MPDNPAGKMVYPAFEPRNMGTGGGDEPPSHDLILRLVDTKIEASEEKLMRHVVEKTSQVEIDLSKQISNVSTQVSGITRSVIFATLGTGLALLGILYAVDQFVFDSSSRSFDVGQEVGNFNSTIQTVIESNSEKIDQLIQAVIEGQKNVEPKTGSQSE